MFSFLCFIYKNFLVVGEAKGLNTSFAHFLLGGKSVKEVKAKNGYG